MASGWVLDGMDQLKRNLSNIGSEAPKAFAAAATEILEEVIASAKEVVPVNEGVLRASGTVLPPLIAGPRVVVVCGFGGQAKDYAIVVHEGRRAGAKRPPVDPIKRWARKKGIPEDAAYMIAKRIGERGIKGRKYLETPFLARVPAMPLLLAEGVAHYWQRIVR